MVPEFERFADGERRRVGGCRLTSAGARDR
jgi:hypothetical protein